MGKWTTAHGGWSGRPKPRHAAGRWAPTRLSISNHEGKAIPPTALCRVRAGALDHGLGPAWGLPCRVKGRLQGFPALPDLRTGLERTLLVGVLVAVVGILLAACGGVPVHDSDRAVLVALFNATDGRNWTNNSNWLSDRPPDKWHGVTIDHGGRVTHLRLPRNGLAGRIPPELGSLQKLQILDFQANQLGGPIPPELGDLDNLTGLYLAGNRLTGQVPRELGNLRELTSLSLYGNQLSGDVPPEALDNLANLTWLALDENDLRGCVPNALRDQLSEGSTMVRGLPFCDEVPAPRPCKPGMTLWPGDYCTIDAPPPPESSLHPAWPYQMRVEGEVACFGGTCSVERVKKYGFHARKHPDKSWTVIQVP